MSPSPAACCFCRISPGSGNPDFNPGAKGIVYGLTLDSTREDLIQAVIEGLCYELRLHSDAFAKAGISIQTLRAVGGGRASTNSCR